MAAQRLQDQGCVVPVRRAITHPSPKGLRPSQVKDRCLHGDNYSPKTVLKNSTVCATTTLRLRVIVWFSPLTTLSFACWP